MVHVLGRGPGRGRWCGSALPAGHNVTAVESAQRAVCVSVRGGSSVEHGVVVS
jgi:hypothetical protein